MENNFTIVVSHYVKPGKTQEFEQALKQVIQKAKAYQGYQGIEIIQTNNSNTEEYVLLIRFDTEANYNIWEQSAPRNEWFEELKTYIVKESKIRYEEGIEFWFSLPNSPTTQAPKKWKMALLTWMVIYPLVLTLSTLAGIFLYFLHPYLRVLAVSLVLVPLMTYIVMPKITQVFASWIFKKE